MFIGFIIALSKDVKTIIRQYVSMSLTSAHPRNDIRIFHKECRSLASNGYKITLLVSDGLGNEFVDGVNIIGQV